MSHKKLTSTLNIAKKNIISVKNHGDSSPENSDSSPSDMTKHRLKRFKIHNLGRPSESDLWSAEDQTPKKSASHHHFGYMKLHLKPVARS